MAAVLPPYNPDESLSGVIEDLVDNGTTNQPYLELTDIPYQFNPPLHPSLYLPDWSLSGRDSDDFYRDSKSQISEGPSDEGLLSYRLGRVMMSDQVFRFALSESGDLMRYGFRFLYNPTTVSGSQNISTNFIPNPSSPVGMVLQTGLEAITLTLLLNRSPELQGGASKDDYIHPLNPGDWEGIKERGTHYDLEYLYRVANGTHNTQMRDGTGDIGILLPNPANLLLGPNRTYGAIGGIIAKDIMFTGDYVPMITEVSISFARFLSFDPQWSEEYSKTLAGSGVGTSGGSSGSSPSTGGGGSSGGGTAMTGPEVFRLAQTAWNDDRLATIATQIAWGESSWNPGNRNPDSSTGDNSYGLWQINMLGNLGPDRIRRYGHLGLTRNEDLYNPTINAKVAHAVYMDNGQSFRPWTVYTSGKYQQAPFP